VPFWISFAVVIAWVAVPIVAGTVFLLGLALAWLFRGVEALTRRIPASN
jgi:hypothetical protein